MSKYKTDEERLEIVKGYKRSKKTISEYAKEAGISRCTLRDWIHAYDNIDGEFVRLRKNINDKGVIMENEECQMKVLTSEEIYKKSNHFSRFDHSIVVMEFANVKITTSLEQALKLMEQFYDRSR